LHGWPCAWYAPTFPTLQEVWRKLCTVLAPVIKKKSEQSKRLELITGGVIECWSLNDPDAGRGRKYKTVVIDEAAMILHLEDAFENNIRPLLADYRGECWLLSTPKGMNYFQTLFEKGLDSNPNRDPDWASFQMPTWANPYIDPREIESMRQGMPRLSFLQEIEAQFVSFAGTFIKAEHLRSGQPPDGMKLYQGVDLAISMKENADYTAIVTVGVDESGRVWIVDAERRRVGFRDALDFIKQKAARYHPVDIAIESVQYQAAVVEELLRSTNLPVRSVKPDKDKLTRAQGLITRYENGLVWHNTTLPSDFVNEILAFGPDCEHDDYMDAAVYAYMLTGDYGKPFFILPEEPTMSDKQKSIAEKLPGLNRVVVEAMESVPAGDVCGVCGSFDEETGRCRERNMGVGPGDLACPLFY
jgi:predicted phage terminase large subunit-like protein